MIVSESNGNGVKACGLTHLFNHIKVHELVLENDGYGVKE
jgi:hypothetical protein